MVKRIVMTLVTIMLLFVSAQAQRGFRLNLSVHGNFGSGISDIVALQNEIDQAGQTGDASSIVANVPSFGIGLCGGYSGKLFLIDANFRLNYGATLGESTKNQQFDKLAYVSAGLRLLKFGIVELDLKLGYGVSFTNFTIENVNSSIESSNMIMPLSTTFWIGGTHAMHHRIGLSFEYIFSVANLHDTQYENAGEVASSVLKELSIAPSTMNVALRYQF